MADCCWWWFHMRTIFVGRNSRTWCIRMHSDAEFSRTQKIHPGTGSDELTINDNTKGRSKPEISRHLQNPVYTDVAERTSLSTPELLWRRWGNAKANVNKLMNMSRASLICGYLACHGMNCAPKYRLETPIKCLQDRSQTQALSNFKVSVQRAQRLKPGLPSDPRKRLGTG
jgi:hypothetical protein